MGLTTKIFIGLLAGIGGGLFFGESCAFLKIVGDAFIGLLQMTVLPYIVVSLILNVGRLSISGGKRLVLHALAVFAGLWAIGLMTMIAVPLCLPGRTSGSFFSTSIIEPAATVDFVGLYIPTNPFKALALGFVPAVVLFCVCIGAAISRISNRAGLLDNLDVIAAALTRINVYVVKLTPIGVFAITCAAAGTMAPDEFGRLQAYLIIITTGAAFLIFWAVPMAVSAVSPFSYRDVIRAGKSPVVTAFATGKVFVVLPLIIENVERLLADRLPPAEDSENVAPILVPLAFPFPKLGGLVILYFIPFSAWFVGDRLALGDYPLFLAAGLLSIFGNPIVVVPFLLDLMELPEDMFQLFIISTVLSDRVRNALNAIFLLVIALLTTCSLRGKLQLRLRKLAMVFAVAVVIMLGVVILTRGYLDRVFKKDYAKDKIIARMQLLSDPVTFKILDDAEPNPVALQPGASRMSRIRERRVIRIGYVRDQLPFVYVNDQGELVGFDVDMAHRLATDLKVSIEFVPVDARQIDAAFASDHCDVIMSGMAKTLARAESMTLSRPYMDLNLALVVADHDADRFRSLDAIRSQDTIRLGVLSGGYFSEQIAWYLPEAEFVELDSYRTFFEHKSGTIDLLVASAEAGSAWTLLYPSFQVINPMTRKIGIPLVYPVAGSAEEPLVAFIDNWIDLRVKDGTVDRFYQFWILGQAVGPAGPRWSIARDVLGWLD